MKHTYENCKIELLFDEKGNVEKALIENVEVKLSPLQVVKVVGNRHNRLVKEGKDASYTREEA